MEKKQQHGGFRKGSGRKSKIEEIHFIEKLDNIIDNNEAINKLKELIYNKNFNAIKLYLEYRYGKPKETIENINHNLNHELTKEDAHIINDILEEKY